MARYYDPGAVGANDGTSWADAWTNLQTANNSTTLALSPLYLRNTTGSNIVLAGVITLGTNAGIKGSNLEWIGCNTSGVEDGTRVTFDGNAGAYNMFTSTMDYRSFRNIAFTNSGTGYAGFDSSIAYYNILQNCDFFQGSVASKAVVIGGYSIIIDSQFRNYTSVTDFALELNSAQLIRCDVLHCANGAYSTSVRGCSLLDCVFHGCSIYGVRAIGSNCFAVNSVFDSNDIGIYSQYPLQTMVACRFTNNTTAAIKGLTYAPYAVRSCFRGNGADTSGSVYRIDDGPTLTSDGYVDAANHDFRLVYTDPARSVQIGQYIPIKAYTPAGLGIMEQPRRRVQAIGL